MKTGGHRGLRGAARAMLALLLSSALLLNQWGYSAGKVKYTPPPPLDTRYELGTIGLSPSCDPPGLDLHRPMGKSEAAAFGATSWGLAPIKKVDTPLSGNTAKALLFLIVAFFVFWIIVPAAIILGATSGAMTGMSEGKFEDVKSRMDGAVAALGIQEGLHAGLVKSAEETAGVEIVMIEPEGPTGTAPEVDTLIEFCSGDLSLVPEEKGMKPPIAMNITVSLKVTRTSDGVVLLTESIPYWSKFHRFNRWAKKDSRLFREELELLYHAASEKAAGLLFEPAPEPATE
jgi:hypothetical protein